MNSTYLYLTLINAALQLAIAIFMLIGAIGFFRDWRNGSNGFTASLLIERLALFGLFIGQFFTGLGIWYFFDYLNRNRDFLLLWVIAFKIIIVINIVMFYVEVQRAKHN